VFRTKSVEHIGQDTEGEGDAHDVGRLRRNLWLLFGLLVYAAYGHRNSRLRARRAVVDAVRG
jgi:hypothetical protein